MLGRGIDCILPHPSNPALHEDFAKSALDYVALAERKHGLIPRPVGYDYIWGDLLEDLNQEEVAAKIVNLETSVTVSDKFLPKGINYRMHPSNIPALAAPKIDCCALANNHILDWGTDGLAETLHVLRGAGIQFAGAGMTLPEATAPAPILLRDGRRILVFGFALQSSGVPASWAAGINHPGVNLLQDLSDTSLKAISKRVIAVRAPKDVLVASTVTKCKLPSFAWPKIIALS